MVRFYGSPGDKTIPDAINAFDGGVRAVVGAKATAGIFASYPAPHLGILNGLVDQVKRTSNMAFTRGKV